MTDWGVSLASMSPSSFVSETWPPAFAGDSKGRGEFEGGAGNSEGAGDSEGARGAGGAGARPWFLYVGLGSPALGDGGFVDVGGQGYVPEADAVGLEEGDVVVGVAGGFSSGNDVS